jgi:choice-of-anchor B domain-containing protein
MNRRLALALTLTLSVLVAMPSAGQQFGTSTAVHGDTILAGDGRSQIRPGVVYLFGQISGGEWAETGRVTAPENDGSVDGFGSSMAVHGNLMLVGAPGKKTIYLYKNTGSTWSLISTVSNPATGFGEVVALSNDTAVVSNPGTADDPGTVWIYSFAADIGLIEEDHFGQEKDELGSLFGTSLALVGDKLLVGAPGTNLIGGRVDVMTRDAANKWVNSGTLPSIPASNGDQTGLVLASNGNKLAVGAPGFSGRSGTVWLFSLENGEFNLDSRLSPYSSSRNDLFGSSIALGIDQIWVGSPGEGGRAGTGAVYTFGIDENHTILGVSRFPTSNLVAGSGFGSAIAFNGKIAAVGASGIDNRAGAVIPFVKYEPIWQQGPDLVDDTEGYDSVAGELIECENELAGDFPCKDVDMTSFVSMKDLGADRGIRTNDLWGWEDPETGREYAIVGLSNQTSFVDVTDVFNPIYLGKLPMPPTANISVWRDMKVYKDHAYIVSDGAGAHGMQVFDLRQLRHVTTPVTFEETNHYAEIFSAHNIVINEETGFAYSVGSSSGGETCGGGLHMIDLKDPANPVFAGCFTDGSTGRRGTGYSHDAQCVIYHGPDAAYSGQEICFGSNETALSIANVTDKKAPYSISIATYPSVAYAHQGWLTDDHRYFYLNDELDEAGNLVDGTRTLIWDLIDLDEPVLAGEHIATTTETDHNLYVKGNLMYQSNTSAGLRILDITDPLNPFETAYFDTSPIGGRGVSWSNYPYFKSGSIVVTGGHYGLFILKKKEVDL